MRMCREGEGGRFPGCRQLVLGRRLDGRRNEAREGTRAHAPLRNLERAERGAHTGGVCPGGRDTFVRPPKIPPCWRPEFHGTPTLSPEPRGYTTLENTDTPTHTHSLTDSLTHSRSRSLCPETPKPMSERGHFRHPGRGGGHGGPRTRGGGAGRGGGQQGAGTGAGAASAAGGQQQEKPKKENILDLSKYMDKEVNVKFNGGREGR